MSDLDTRRAYLALIDSWVQMKVPYIWGGKDSSLPTPPNTDAGLDCSGCVCKAMEVLNLVPDGFALEHNSQWLWDHLSPTDDPQIGDLCLYGSESVDHVMVFVGDGRVVGSSGAGKNCTDAATARRLGVGVHYKNVVKYRTDFLGYRSLPVGGLSS